MFSFQKKIFVKTIIQISIKIIAFIKVIFLYQVRKNELVLIGV